MLLSEGGVRMIIVATDEQVYQSLQPYVNQYTSRKKLHPLVLDAVKMRKSYERAWDLANMLNEMNHQKLKKIAQTWLMIEGGKDAEGNPILGKDLVAFAIAQLLSPLPDNPRIATYEISLQIDTGNVIHLETDDFEVAKELLDKFTGNSKEILRRISPKKTRL